MWSRLINYLVSLVLPALLGWAYGHAKKELQDREDTLKRNENQDAIDETNLKKYAECKNLEACIATARDVFNGTPIGEMQKRPKD